MFEGNREADGMLAFLVDAMNNTAERCEDGPALTLTVQGVIISGKIIPDWQWFEDVEQLCENGWFTSGGPDTGNRGWAQFFKLAQEGLAQRRSEAKVVGDVVTSFAQKFRDALVDVDRPTHIHLRDVRAFPAGVNHPIPNTGTYWRGKVADVSGWSLGPPTARANVTTARNRRRPF